MANTRSGYKSERGLHERCNATYGTERCTVAAVVSFGLCKGHYTQKQRGLEFSKLRHRRPEGLVGLDLVEWCIDQGVSRSGRMSTACLIWPFATRTFSDDKPGYAVVNVGNKPIGGIKGAQAVHRLVGMYILNGGVKLLRSDVVHHLCAMPPCYNPEHLVITSAAHNASEALMRKENLLLREENRMLRSQINLIEGAANMHKIGKPEGWVGPEADIRKILVRS